MGLRDSLHRSTRPLRGQLQRFVMTTIRVMAWPVPAKLTAHGEKRLLAKASRYHTASCVATSTNANQPNLRASNSSGLPPRHHVGPQPQQFAMTIIRVMAWPVRTELTAHATRATPGKSLSDQTASHCLFQQIPTIQACEHPIPAHSTHAITKVNTRWWDIPFLFYSMYVSICARHHWNERLGR